MNELLKSKVEKAVSNFSFDVGLNLNNIPASEREILLEKSIPIELAKKEALFHEGESPKGIYILMQGKLKLAQLSVDGTEQIIFIYAAGIIMGHRPLLGGDKQPVTAWALEPCSILFVEKEHFLKVLSNSDELSKIILQSTCHEFTLLVNRINVFAQRGIRERLALFLLVLNETYKSHNQQGPQSEIKINRNDLAGYVGTSVENLVRSLRVLKENNLVRTKGKSIFINNFEELYAIARL